MTASITQFAALNPPQATGQQLDDMFTLAAEQAPVPCNASGTNTITLTQQPNVPTVPAYSNNMQLTAVATGTNTGPAVAGLGSLAQLNIYKDSSTGPVALVGGEIVNGNAFTLRYDPALNSSAGGWHLFTNTATVAIPAQPSSIQINGGSTITSWLSGTASISFSTAAANSSEDKTFSVSGIGPAQIPQVGDFVEVVPPSLALAGIMFQGMVLAAGSLTASTSQATINVRALNAVAATQTPPGGIYRYSAKRTVP